MTTTDDVCPSEYSIPRLLPLATGTPTLGLWCDTCLLPSRVEAPVFALGPDGPTEIGVASRCAGCQT